MYTFRPSVEKEVARNFCNNLQELRVKYNDQVIIESLDDYLTSLHNQKKTKLIVAILEELDQCHPGILEKTNFYQTSYQDYLEVQ